MQGSPWHVERMERGDGDKRRHRSRCVHYHKHAALGKALLRHKEGDTVRVKINDEAVKYKITKIR